MLLLVSRNSSLPTPLLVGFLLDAIALLSSTLITSPTLVSRNLNSARIIDNLVKEEEEENDEDFNLPRL